MVENVESFSPEFQFTRLTQETDCRILGQRDVKCRQAGTPQNTSTGCSEKSCRLQTKGARVEIEIGCPELLASRHSGTAFCSALSNAARGASGNQIRPILW